MIPGERLSALAEHYDLVIVGGGITGAGVFREAVRTGASVLLVEARDFASGTSSGSSKLVHGGLRYLQSGQWRLTPESVRERSRLLRQVPGLVEPQTFLLPVYRDRPPRRTLIQAGLLLYDLMAGAFTSRWLPADKVLQLEPELASEGLRGAMLYEDARTDDARLVQRLIEDSRSAGGTALNYCRAEDLVRDDSGRVAGVVLRDVLGAGSRSIRCSLVINATGEIGRASCRERV
jgi:glycerol-3-phosphate dehydrogenase